MKPIGCFIKFGLISAEIAAIDAILAVSQKVVGNMLPELSRSCFITDGA